MKSNTESNDDSQKSTRKEVKSQNFPKLKILKTSKEISRKKSSSQTSTAEELPELDKFLDEIANMNYPNDDVGKTLSSVPNLEISPKHQSDTPIISVTSDKNSPRRSRTVRTPRPLRKSKKEASPSPSRSIETLESEQQSNGTNSNRSSKQNSINTTQFNSAQNSTINSASSVNSAQNSSISSVSSVSSNQISSITSISSAQNTTELYIPPLYNIFENLISQTQNPEASLKLLLILNELSKLTDDETGIQKWRTTERLLSDFLGEKKTENFEEKIIEKEQMINEKDKIILEKDKLILEKDLMLKSYQEKIFDNKKPLPSIPTKHHQPPNQPAPLSNKFISRKFTKTIAGQPPTSVPPKTPSSEFFVPPIPPLVEDSTVTPPVNSSNETLENFSLKLNNNTRFILENEKEKSPGVLENKWKNFSKSPKNGFKNHFYLKKGKKKQPEEMGELWDGIEVKKDYEKLKLEYEKVLKKLQILEEEKEQKVESNEAERDLMTKDMTKLTEFKGEIDEFKKRLLIEKEILEKEQENIAAQKFKLEEEIEEIAFKRIEIDEENQILNEMRAELDNERQQLEKEAHFTFMQIAQLQEAKTAIVTGNVEEFMESIESLNNMDMVLNSDDSRYTLLHWAVIYNQQPMVSELLKRGAKILPSANGFTPLDIAKAAYEKGCTSFSPLLDLFVKQNDNVTL